MKSLFLQLILKVAKMAQKMTHFLVLVAPFWHLFSGIDLLRHFGRPLARLWLPLARLWLPLASFWFPLALFWLFLDSLRLPFGDLWLNCGALWFLFSTLGLDFHVFSLNFLIFKFHRIFSVAFYKNYVKSIGNEMVSQFNVFLTICFFSCHVFLHPISKKTRTRPKAPPSKTSFRSHRDLPWTRSGNLPQAT